MPSSRLVECLDCGYRWESGAEDPRCSKSDCGRSRNVEPVEDTVDDDLDDEDEADEKNQIDSEPEPVEDDDSSSTSTDDSSSTDGYTPAFEASTVRSDNERGSVSSSTSTDEDEADEDTDDDSSSTSTSTDEDEAPEVPDIEPEQLKPAVEATFNMVAVSRGQHWKLDEDEAEQLADGWTPVVNHYAPYLLKENALIVTAAITSYGVLAPRLAKDRELAQQAERDSVDDEAGAGSVRQTVVEDAVEDEQTDEQTPSDSGAAPGGYASV